MKLPFRAAVPLLLLAFAAGPAHAQGEDALVLPRGVVEGSAPLVFRHFDSLLGSSKVPLGALFDTPFPASTFARTAPARDSLQKLYDALGAKSGAGAFALSTEDVRLGTYTVNLAAEQRTAPLSMRMGVTNWLTLGVTVPIEWRATEVDGAHFTDAGLGANPSATINQARLASIDSSLARYGTAAYLPLRESPAGRELERRYEAARKAGDTTTLALPTHGLSETEFQELLQGRAGSVYPFFGAMRLYRPGDVEVSARVRLMNPIGVRLRPGRDSASGVRVALEGALRLPTGKGADLDTLVEVPGASGHGGASGAVFADLFRGRLWLSAAGRWTHPFARDVVRRTYPTGNPFVPLSDSILVSRTPGDRLELGFTPRFRLTDEISLAGRYALARQGATTLGTTPDAGLSFAGIESTEAQTAQLAGGGMSYSTLTAYGRGTAKVPYEFSLLYERVIAGSGGTPGGSVVTATGRVYVQAWGGVRRPRPDTAARDSTAARPPAGPPADARPRPPVAPTGTVSPAPPPAAQPSTAPETRGRVAPPGREVPKVPAPATTTGNPPPAGTTPPSPPSK
ncbi:MAG: hypothetical protein JWM27_2075 [Gemmatimonadetes bacterium]|nr:hypothetical protein [Gemmatimonadota bacterium]